MNIIDLFHLPEGCRFKTAITKVSLKDREATTISERRLLDKAEIKKIEVFGLLKTENSNILSYVDEKESYLEVFFIHITIEDKAYDKLYKGISRLLHKLIPHHCIVVCESENHAHISLYNKHISKNSPDLRVLDKKVISLDLKQAYNEAFALDLDFKKANKTNLNKFYAYYTRAIQNYKLSELTGTYMLREEAATYSFVEIQKQYGEKEQELNQLIKELKNSQQMNERVPINIKIQEVKKEMEWLIKQL